MTNFGIYEARTSGVQGRLFSFRLGVAGGESLSALIDTERHVDDERGLEHSRLGTSLFMFSPVQPCIRVGAYELRNEGAISAFVSLIIVFVSPLNVRLRDVLAHITIVQVSSEAHRRRRRSYLERIPVKQSSIKY